MGRRVCMVLSGCPDHDIGELFLRLTVVDQIAGVPGDRRAPIASLPKMTMTGRGSL